MNYKKLLLVGTLLSCSTLLFGAEGGQGPAEVQGGAHQVETTVTIQTSDGQEFEVPLSRANKSSVLKGILFAFGKDVPEDLVIPLENIDAETFTFIVDWLGEVLSVEDEADAKERAQIILQRKLAAIMKGVEDLQLEDLQSNVDKVIKIALAINFLNIHLDAEGNDGEWAISVAATFLADIIRVHAKDIRNGTLHFNLFENQRVDGGGVCELLGQILAVRTPYKDRVLEEHTDWVTSLAVLSGNRIASGSWDKTVRVWDASTGECLQVLEGHTKPVTSLAVLPGNRIASGSDDNTIRAWDASTGKCLQVLEGHTNSVSSLASLSGNLLASGSWDDTVRVWDASTGECLKILRGHTRPVRCLAGLSGNRIVSGSLDGEVRLWDASTGECLPLLEGQTNEVSSLAVLPGDRIVLGSADTSVHVWNASTGECLQVLEGHTKPVISLAVLSGNRIVSGSADNTMRVWNASTGECLLVLEGHTDAVVSLAVLPDGSIVAGSNGKVLVWSNLLMRHKDRLTIQQAVILFAILQSKALPPAGSSAHAVWMSMSEAIRDEVRRDFGIEAYDDAVEAAPAPAAEPAG